MENLVKVYSRDYAFAQLQGLCIALWRGRTTRAAVELGDRILNEVAPSAGPLRLLTVVEGRASVPDRDACVALSRFLSQSHGRIQRSAVAIEGEGFRAVTMRTIVNSLVLFGRPQFPHKAFADVSSAARFVTDDADPFCQVVDAERACLAVRETRRHPAKPPKFAWMNEDTRRG